MDRRAFLAAATAFLAVPRGAEAQQAGKIYRVGLLAHATPEAASAPMALFRQSLEQLGWLEGRNVSLELRLVERQDQLARAATGLAGSGVDVIVTVATPAVLAAKGATTRIPIVMVSALDPIQSGVVSSLGRPEANITGMRR